MTSQPTVGHIENVNGVTVYFEVHGDGEPVVLLHGFLGSSQDWIPSLGEWGSSFRLIVPDLRGHGRSCTLKRPFRHDEASSDIFALLDHLKIERFNGVGISGGGNILLHLATKQPERVKAMVLVSATPYFPTSARNIMRQYAENLPPDEWHRLRQRHQAGDPQIEALLASADAFANSYDDMNFTPPYLSTIQARTLIVQGDHDPLYSIDLSIEMAKAIPGSSLWVVPNAGHGPIIGDTWREFVKRASAFLRT